jgi:hypothetical protein
LCQGQDTPSLARDKIAPAHVQGVHQELELIRFELARPVNRQQELPIENAEPREVYFQALSLFTKANQLYFKHTRERLEPMQDIPASITPGDIYAVVDRPIGLLRRVRSRLEIHQMSSPVQSDPSHTPSNVFKSIVQANR